MASAVRRPLPGLVHHSDRSVQYASAEYVETLKQPEAGGEIYANEYTDMDDLRAHIEDFIERCLQPEATALSTRLPLAGGVRAERAVASKHQPVRQ